MKEELYQKILKELDELSKKILNMSDDEFEELAIANGYNLSVDFEEQKDNRKKYYLIVKITKEGKEELEGVYHGTSIKVFETLESARRSINSLNRRYNSNYRIKELIEGEFVE